MSNGIVLTLLHEAKEKYAKYARIGIEASRDIKIIRKELLNEKKTIPITYKRKKRMIKESE